MLRLIAAPIVSENGVTVGMYAPVVEFEKEAPVSGPTVDIRLAPLKERAVLFVPPHARPVTEPLPPEFVPPRVNANCSGNSPGSEKSVSLAYRNTFDGKEVFVVAVKVKSSWGAMALPIMGLLCDVFTTRLKPNADTEKLRPPTAPIVSGPVLSCTMISFPPEQARSSQIAAKSVAFAFVLLIANKHSRAADVVKTR